MSIFECSSHLRQASLETVSKTRCPSGPLNGGLSSPSATTPNFTHCTFLDISEFLFQLHTPEPAGCSEEPAQEGGTHGECLYRGRAGGWSRRAEPSPGPR